MGLDVRKPVIGGLRTTKVQTSLHRLVRAFVIHILESIISKLATRKISTFKTGLNLVLSEAQKTGFVALPI